MADDRPKVGLIRGAYLSQFEMQTYEHLMADFDLTAFALRINRFSLDPIRVPIHRMRSIDDPVTLFSRKLGFYFNLALQATNGRDYFHLGLVEALKGFAVAHTMETFNAFSWQALQAKKKYGCKLVVTEWENRPYAAERFAAKRRMKYEVLEAADLFLAPTGRARDCLVLEGADPAKILVLSPGVNTERFSPRERPLDLAADYGVEAGDFVILSVAALVWEKGVHDLLHAVKRLTMEGADLPPIKLLFAGGGPEKASLVRLRDRIGLGDVVHFVRFPYEEIHRAYNLADVFVLASTARRGWLEQFGYVLPEAMASGLPVLTTLSGSIPEVVGDAGLTVPPSDFIALAEGLARLVGDAGLRETLGARGRRRALDTYDARKNGLAIGEAYRRLLA